jgi:hypothetical protein
VGSTYNVGIMSYLKSIVLESLVNQADKNQAMPKRLASELLYT